VIHVNIEDVFEKKPEAVKPAGIAKGAYVVANGFPGIMRDGYTKGRTRLVEVWGIAHEMGSAYSHQIREISAEEFESLRKESPSGGEPEYRMKRR
jgi:hypothetical protein